MSALAPPLDARDQARGRSLAIASHPAGNTFRMVFTQHLPTLALVSLGASEFQVGMQGAFVFAFIVLQLPTLRALAWLSKRGILVGSHLFALLFALPLVWWDRLPELAALMPWQTGPVDLAMASFALVAIGFCIGETVWFPMLRAYVEPQRIGRFFGALRTGWHLALILFYGFSQWWLARHPGDFATLFGVGFGLGVARTFLIARMPERKEHGGERIRVREVVVLLREARLRNYLISVAWSHSMRIAAVPFVLVMLRRAAGFSDDQVIYTTVAHFTGGVASLYLWGRAVDRVGALSVLRITTVGQALLIAGLCLFSPAALVPLMVLWFFALSVLASGHGVADTHVLFELTPPETPTPTLVLGAVGVGLAGGLMPILAGALLDLALPEGGGSEALWVYRLFFGLLGGLLLLALLPLRALARAQRPR